MLRIGNYELDSPLINAGGVVKTMEDVRQMSQTGVGAILAGSFTKDARIGNSPNGERVYYHDPESRTTYNSLGMPNPGIAYLAMKLPEMQHIAHDHGKPLILNLAPTSKQPASEFAQMLRIIADAGVEEVDGIELNAGCPNVVSPDGSRHELLSHHHELLGDTLLVIHEAAHDLLRIGSMIVRISPFRDEDDALRLARVLVDVPVDAVSAFNTFPGGIPLDNHGGQILEVPGGAGGQSGPGMQTKAEVQTTWLTQARETEGATFEIIGSNGVHDAISLKRRIDLGAKAVSLTTLFYESSNWKTSVDTILQDYASL